MIGSPPGPLINDTDGHQKPSGSGVRQFQKSRDELQFKSNAGSRSSDLQHLPTLGQARARFLWL